MYFIADYYMRLLPNNYEREMLRIMRNFQEELLLILEVETLYLTTTLSIQFILNRKKISVLKRLFYQRSFGYFRF